MAVKDNLTGGEKPINISSLKAQGSGSRYRVESVIDIEVENYNMLTFDARYQLGTGGGTASLYVYDMSSGSPVNVFTRYNPIISGQQVDISNCEKIRIHVGAGIAADITSDGWCEMYNISIE